MAYIAEKKEKKINLTTKYNSTNKQTKCELKKYFADYLLVSAVLI